MKDEFKRISFKWIGHGGVKCGCCVGDPTPKGIRRRRRQTRRRLKADTRRRIAAAL